jgi:nicotinamidase-related amidase
VISRISAERLAILVIDVQPRFIELGGPGTAAAIVRIEQLLRLAGELHLPLLATLEEPVEVKGKLPRELEAALPNAAQIHHKWTYDCCAEPHIDVAIRSLARPQFAVAGAETDVCVLQTVVSLLEREFETFVVEDCVFSSAIDTSSALERMRKSGAVPITYKSLYYELMGRVRTDAQPAGLMSPSELPQA